MITNRCKTSGAWPRKLTGYKGAYNYKLVYRPGRLNGNAGLMSRLPLPATAEDTSANLRLSDPSDVDVYFVGASGVQPRLGRRRDISLGGLGCRTEGRDISLGGLECRTKGKGISLGWAGVSNGEERHHLRWAGVSNRRFFLSGGETSRAEKSAAYNR